MDIFSKASMTIAIIVLVTNIVKKNKCKICLNIYETVYSTIWNWCIQFANLFCIRNEHCKVCKLYFFVYLHIYVYWYTNVPETFINILVYRMHASIHTVKKVFIFKGKNITIMYFGIAIWYIRLKRLYICIIRV